MLPMPLIGLQGAACADGFVEQVGEGHELRVGGDGQRQLEGWKPWLGSYRRSSLTTWRREAQEPLEPELLGGAALVEPAARLGTTIAAAVNEGAARLAWPTCPRQPSAACAGAAARQPPHP